MRFVSWTRESLSIQSIRVKQELGLGCESSPVTLPPIYNRVDFVPFPASIRVTASQASIKPKVSVILSEEPIEQNDKNELTVNPQEFQLVLFPLFWVFLSVRVSFGKQVKSQNQLFSLVPSILKLCGYLPRIWEKERRTGKIRILSTINPFFGKC